MSLEFNVPEFKKRLDLLRRAVSGSGCAAFVSCLGKGDEETQAQLAGGLHSWLLGVPFANTMIAVSETKCAIIAAAKQTKHLQPLASDSVRILTREKDVEQCKQLAQTVFSEFGINPDDPAAKVAVFINDKPQSPVAQALLAPLDGRELVDLSRAFCDLLDVKDESELRCVRMAARTASKLAEVFVDRMARALDEGTAITNTALVSQLQQASTDSSLLLKLRIGSEFDPIELDWVSAPLVNGTVDEKAVELGVITVDLLMSYKAYKGGLSRTYLVNASAEQSGVYTALLAAEKRAIEAAVADNPVNAVYAAAAAVIAEKLPGLALSASIGHSVGLVTDSSLDVTKDNARKLKPNETLLIKLEVVDASGVKYTVGDTVRVTGEDPVVFTDAAKNSGDIAFELDDAASTKKPGAHAAKPAAARALRDRGDAPRQTRAQRTRAEEESNEKALEMHQKVLKTRLQERGEQKYASNEPLNKDDEGPVFKRFEAYKRETQLPKTASLNVSVDARASSLILPVSGKLVPFHINTFRSGSITNEGPQFYLRLNFHSPDSMLARRDTLPYEDAGAQFVKSATFRSRDGERLKAVLKQTQDMKKEATKKENEKRQLADVVQQDKLAEITGKRPLRLEPVFIRPSPEGKRVPGAVEIHRNGVRYTSPFKEQTVEVLFSNVENLFFQPNTNELISLIHFHLKQPILVGKRKTKDVQFYRDATDISADDTGAKKRRYKYGDEDELEQEEEERKFRVKLNKEFYKYADEIAKASRGQLDVDVPFRELGFNGVPYRANQFLQPTTNCLVQLSETPFYIAVLSEVELAVLERVRFGLKQFDLVFVFKDYKRAVSQINSIPMTQLDAVKSWLNEVDIPFYEAELNFNWKEVMATINASRHQFFTADGGWSFLDPEDDEAEVLESEEGEEEFSVSDDEPDDESEEFDDESESDGSFSGESESESAEDWSDLEEKAKAEDKKGKRE